MAVVDGYEDDWDPNSDCTHCGGEGYVECDNPSSAWPRTSGTSCVRAERAAEQATQKIR